MKELIKYLKESVEELERLNEQIGIKLDEADKYLNSARKNINESKLILTEMENMEEWDYETGEIKNR